METTRESRLIIDLGLLLNLLRLSKGMTQREVAHQSGVGEKTISTMETGKRIASLKVEQLRRILGVYGVTLEYFFSEQCERDLSGEPTNFAGEVTITDVRLYEIVTTIQGLSDERRERLIRGTQQTVQAAKLADRRGLRLVG